MFNLIVPLLYVQVWSASLNYLTIPLVAITTFSIIRIFQLTSRSRIPCSDISCLRQPMGAHCKTCNTCTLHFDHHCWWLGTCIVKSNYAQFIVLLVSLYAQCFIGILKQLPTSLNYVYWPGFIYLNIILVIHLVAGGRK